MKKEIRLLDYTVNSNFKYSLFITQDEKEVIIKVFNVSNKKKKYLVFYKKFKNSMSGLDELSKLINQLHLVSDFEKELVYNKKGGKKQNATNNN